MELVMILSCYYLKRELFTATKTGDFGVFQNNKANFNSSY